MTDRNLDASLTPKQIADAQSLQTVLNSVSDAFIAMDKEWQIKFVNDSYVRLVSAIYPTKEHLVGHNLWERFPDVRDSPTGVRYRAALEQQKAGLFRAVLCAAAFMAGDPRSPLAGRAGHLRSGDLGAEGPGSAAKGADGQD